MPLPPSDPSNERHIARQTQRSGNLERRFPAQRFLPIVFDGLGAELTPGIKGDVPIHFAAKIVGWRLLADQAGDLVVDIWKTDYGSYPPTITDTITASAQPALSGDEKANDTTLTGWTTDISEGETLRFHIDSVSTVTRVTLTLILVA